MPVKSAMLVDYGSRDRLFLDAVADVRRRALQAAGTSQELGHECVIMQGSGTMGVEAMLGCAVPREGGKVLLLANGAYGQRQAAICRYLGIAHECMEWLDHEPVSVVETLERLRKATFSHVSLVHHETTCGVLNPLRELVITLKAEVPNVSILVDSMSGFGAYDLQMSWGIDFAVTSANKCLEGVPGFSLVFCNKAALERTSGNARSLSLDIYEQWKGLEATGQFRFTPPTHAVLALRQALLEWEAEGGLEGRAARYMANYEIISSGMEEMGFEFYVPEAYRSFIISSFLLPRHKGFDFQTFYDLLSELGFVIYPGKISSNLVRGESFRIGTIGRVFPKDCEMLVAAVRAACEKMDIELPLH